MRKRERMKIYINKDNQQTGPFEEDSVIERLENGQLSPDDLAIVEGGQNWEKLAAMFPRVEVTPSPTAASLTQTTTGGGCFRTSLLLLGILLTGGGILTT